MQSSISQYARSFRVDDHFGRSTCRVRYVCRKCEAVTHMIHGTATHLPARTTRNPTTPIPTSQPFQVSYSVWSQRTQRTKVAGVQFVYLSLRSDPQRVEWVTQEQEMHPYLRALQAMDCSDWENVWDFFKHLGVPLYSEINLTACPPYRGIAARYASMLISLRYQVPALPADQKLPIPDEAS